MYDFILEWLAVFSNRDFVDTAIYCIAASFFIFLFVAVLTLAAQRNTQ